MSGAAFPEDQVDGGRQCGLERRAQTVGERADLADLGSDQDDFGWFAPEGPESEQEAGDSQVVQAELAARRFEIARGESVERPDAPACPHGVDDDRLRAALEVGKRVQARRA